MDTRAHANAYLKKEGDGFLSADYFLYTRCAVVAEGKNYFEKAISKPSEMPNEIDFEALLGLADQAYELKTGRKMNYFPIFNYETQSNREGWK